MRVATSIAEFSELRASLDPEGARVAYVPTMGALHAGHRSLIRLARATGALVAVSIFVNPLQFGPDEDYARYPRPTEVDLETCRAEGVDVVFVPTVADLYPAGRQVTVNAGPIGSVLEGAFRPGHFDGVLTVVLKMFHIVRPHVAIFGDKDAQQLACVQRMVIDLNLEVDVLGAPTVREPDGLALSSRNVFLSPAERPLARALSESLQAAAGATSVPTARTAACEVLDRAQVDPGFVLDYAALINPSTFAEVPDDHVGPAVLAVAARIGDTRLIDNTRLEFPPPAPAAA